MNAIFSSDISLEGEIAKHAEHEHWLSTLRSEFHILRYEEFVDGRIAGLENYLGVQLP
ncbi:MAG: hypothetical protein ACLQHK_03680 [Gallionellaceae bacterium]